MKILKLLGDFLVGTTYPVRAIALFHYQPKFWRYLYQPLFLNTILVIILFRGLFSLSTHIADYFTDHETVETIMLIFVRILLFFITCWIMLKLSTLICAPWYGTLSEEIEKRRLSSSVNIDVGFAEDLWRGILFELKKLVIGTPLQILAISIFIISKLVWLSSLINLPLALILGVLDICYTTIFLAFSLVLICLDFFDGPLERRRYKFRHKLKIVIQSFPASLGFALVCYFLLLIPFVNILVIPICCIGGGTLFFCDRIFPKLEHQDTLNAQ